MVRRRVADLWRHGRASADESATNWAKLYQQLLADLERLVADRQITDTQARQRFAKLVAQPVDETFPRWMSMPRQTLGC